MRICRPLTITLFALLAALMLFPSPGHAQALKKVRMASSSTNVSFLALYTALHRGFFKDEGIDLEEIIFMPARFRQHRGLERRCRLQGRRDRHHRRSGARAADESLAFHGRKPLLFLMGQKNIKDVKQLKGKKIAGSSPGGSTPRCSPTKRSNKSASSPAKTFRFCKCPAMLPVAMPCWNPASLTRPCYSMPRTSSPTKKVITNCSFLATSSNSPERIRHFREAHPRKPRRSLPYGARHAARFAIYLGQK